MRRGFAFLAFALAGCGASTFTTSGADGGDGGSAPDGSSSADAADEAADASGSRVDSAPPTGSVESTDVMACGSGFCKLPSQVCCIALGKAQCQDTSVPCATTSLFCTSPSNCVGSKPKCCVTPTSTGHIALCAAGCGSNGGSQMCDLNESAITCPATKPCTDSHNDNLGLIAPHGTCSSN